MVETSHMSITVLQRVRSRVNRSPYLLRSLYDIIFELFYLPWHCANLYCNIWDSVGVLVMHGTHTTSMLMHATHLRIYLHLKTSPTVRAARSNSGAGSSSLCHWRRLQCKAAHGGMVCVHVSSCTCTVCVLHCRSNRLHDDILYYIILLLCIYYLLYYILLTILYTTAMRYIWIVYA